MEKVTFEVDGLSLRGTLFTPKKVKEKNPAVLFVHGWTSSQDRSFQYAEALSNLGFICLAFDMRGHGISDGDIKQFSLKEFLKDVIAAYDYLVKVPGVDSEVISAVGASFGGYLSSILSSKRKLTSLVLRVPANYPNDIFETPKHKQSGSTNRNLVAWRKELKQPNETYALQAMQSFTGNVLIIESEKDDIVPRETILNYIHAVEDNSKLTHIVMKDAPHSLREGRFRDEVENILTTWFSTSIRPKHK